METHKYGKAHNILSRIFFEVLKKIFNQLLVFCFPEFQIVFPVCFRSLSRKSTKPLKSGRMLHMLRKHCISGSKILFCFWPDKVANLHFLGSLGFVFSKTTHQTNASPVMQKDWKCPKKSNDRNFSFRQCLRSPEFGNASVNKQNFYGFKSLKVIAQLGYVPFKLERRRLSNPHSCQVAKSWRQLRTLSIARGPTLPFSIWAIWKTTALRFFRGMLCVIF